MADLKGRTFYECSECGRRHMLEEQAEGCAEMHPKPEEFYLDGLKIRWALMPKNLNTYPRSLYIKFEDGTYVNYIMEKGNEEE